MKKGQAAMEFLMTYGWAIIVVLITIGALAYFGVLRPERIFGSSCVLQPGLSCEDFRVDSESVTLIIRNGLGVDITDIDVSLSELPEGVTCAPPNPDTNPDIIGDGSSGNYLFNCGEISGDGLFKATINFEYTKEGYTLTRTVIGSISTGVEETGGVAQCSDASDNDGDGYIDYPNDPGCSDVDDNDENNCGNGFVDGSEECDGGIGGLSCTDLNLGFTGGTLSCYPPGDASECQFDTSGCTSATIVACGYTIDTPGSYIVNAPVSNYNGNCITIRSSHIELDCQNNQIDGDGVGTEQGIVVSPVMGWLDNITIKNCDIKEFNAGLALTNVVNSFIYDSLFTYNVNYGISLSNSNNNRLNSLIITNNYRGIGIGAGVSSNTIYDNHFNNINANVVGSFTLTNYWNTGLTPGMNIIGGNLIGGNYWANPLGNGFSETCGDADVNGICDNAYTVGGTSNIDNFPLTQ